MSVDIPANRDRQYHNRVVQTLRSTDQNRISSLGVGIHALENAYRQGDGQDQIELQRGLSSVLRGETDQGLLSQAVIAITRLGIEQTDPALIRLARQPQAQNEPLKGCLDEYFAKRQRTRTPVPHKTSATANLVPHSFGQELNPPRPRN